MNGWAKKREAKAAIVAECQIDDTTEWLQLTQGDCGKCAQHRWLYAPVDSPEKKLCGTCATHVVSESVPERKAS